MEPTPQDDQSRSGWRDVVAWVAAIGLPLPIGKTIRAYTVEQLGSVGASVLAFACGLAITTGIILAVYWRPKRGR